MSQKRWIETFSRTRIGFGTEAATITTQACSDLDAYNGGVAALTNFYITNRLNQYFSKDDAVTWFNSAVALVAGTYTQQKLGGILRNNAALPASPVVTVTAKAIPMYILKGARNVNNTVNRAEIDTSSNSDADMTGAAGRAKVGGGFAFIPGATLVNAATKIVTFKNMIEANANAGSYVVLEAVNDTTDAINLPRDVFYCNIGNTDMNRNLNQAIEQPITWFLAVCDDSGSRVLIDYVA